MNVVFLLVCFLSSLFSLCVVEDAVPLKSGTHKRAVTTWVVTKYMPLKAIRSYRNNWFLVSDFVGDNHYVERSFVSKSFFCAVVKSEATDIRTGAGSTYPVKFQEKAKKFETYRILKSEDNWVYVMDVHSDTGWIEKKDLWIN